MTTLCQRFGVSRKTAYKWVARHEARGVDALTDQSRRPHASPRQTSPDLEARVLALADAHPTWGGRKLHHALRQAGLDPVPAPSTITGLLRRNGRLRETPGTSPAYVRFERAAPNDLWQLDFKGWHRTRTGKVHPLSVLDDHSRYLLLLHATELQTRDTIQPLLTACFRTYGLPWELLCDNGPPWGTSKPHARTGLDIWFMQLGITPIHGRPLHPQTQGKIERFHRTLKADVFAGRTFLDLADAQRNLDAFRQVYNHRRPHDAVLDHQPPGRVYALSRRPFPETIPDPTYADDAQVRRVAKQGTISVRRRRVVIGEGFAGLDVGVYPTDVDGIVRVQFHSVTIKEVDLRAIDPT
jgi:transposase InsO family protein